jgi:hypothetical protein
MGKLTAKAIIGSVEEFTSTKYCLTNSVAQEPKGSSPHSQQPTTGPYSEPADGIKF